MTPVIPSSWETRFSHPLVHTYSFLLIGKAWNTGMNVHHGEGGKARADSIQLPPILLSLTSQRTKPQLEPYFVPLVTFPDEYCDKVFKF